MRFKVKGKIQWFEGQITNYDGLTGKYGVYFPVDQETVYIFPDDKDVSFFWNCPIAKLFTIGNSLL